MITRKNEQGAALFGALLAMIIFSMLGTVSMNLAMHEIRQVTTTTDDVIARSLAEAGSELVVQWFHDPSARPEGLDTTLLARRYDLPETGSSFFDATGKSQFTGSFISPDLLYDASKRTDDFLLNDSAHGWFRSLRSLGRILKLRVYGPSRPGLLCTVDVTAAVGNITRTVSVQLGARDIPPLRVGVQIGDGGIEATPVTDMPILLHWGDVKIKGDVRLGKIEDIPLRTQLAPVTGLSYMEASRREDRWMDIYIGGQAFFAPSSKPTITPLNVHALQDPDPGLREDHWKYEELKKHALLYGTYYVPDRAGLLYLNGRIETGLGLTPDEVFSSKNVGDHHGLVFVDTLDQHPPKGDNLASLILETEYAEGLFILNTHVHLKAKSMGKSVPALSPPDEGSNSLGSRIPIELSKIHLNGVLYVTGHLSFEGEPRQYGALVTGGLVSGGLGNSGVFEIWYNHELKSGLFRGVPLVYVAPGTWVEKY
jgi:hypothetical protein